MNIGFPRPNSISRPALRAHRRKSALPGASGQTLMEMALLIPIILLLFIGVIEIGRFFYMGILVGNAARAGAEYGIVSTAQSALGGNIIKAAKNDFQNNGQNPTGLTVQPPSSVTGYTFNTADLVRGFAACTCDNGGAFNPTPASTNYCAAPPNGTNATAGTCPPSQHWIIMVGVEAQGTFNSLHIPSNSSFLGIPGSVTIDRISILRAQ